MTGNGMHTGPRGAGGPPTRTQPEQDRDLSYRPPAAGWHAVSAQEVLEGQGSAAQGLRQAQAARRLERVGPNSVEEGHRESLPEALLESLREPLQLLLIVVGVLSAIWGELRDAIAIFAIIAAVAGVETASEWRARKALDALRSLTAPRARALRDGQLLEIPARELVPGDVVALEAGDVVPADCRIIDASGLGVDESALTGEPQAAPKGAGPVASDAPLAARSSMVFSGTAVVDGEGTAVVVATGAASELGRLGRLVAEEQAPVTPLQQSMGELARVILVVAIAASVLVPLVGVLRGQPLRPMVLAGLTLAFATIPEELPILVTVLLAVGGRRLAQRGALLRRLRAGETLGALTVVVTDKTGTLTENRLRLAHLNGAPREVLEVAVGCQSLRSRGGELVGRARGDPGGLSPGRRRAGADPSGGRSAGGQGVAGHRVRQGATGRRPQDRGAGGAGAWVRRPGRVRRPAAGGGARGRQDPARRRGRHDRGDRRPSPHRRRRRRPGGPGRHPGAAGRLPARLAR